MTLGTMNGQGWVFFPTDLAVIHPAARPGYLDEVIRALRQRNIGVLSWGVFNAQDLRTIGDFEPARQFPEWQNERLLNVACYFQEQIREVNPKATCAFNTSHRPFDREATPSSWLNGFSGAAIWLLRPRPARATNGRSHTRNRAWPSCSEWTWRGR